MASEFRDFTVEEIADPSDHALATGPFGSAISSKYFQESGVPVIRGGNLSTDVGIRLSDDGLVFVSEEKKAEFRRSVVRRGDLVFTCWGTINQVGLIDSRSGYDSYVLSNKQMKLTPDPAKASSLFLYYLFSGPGKQSEILSGGIGSSVPGFNLGQLKGHHVSLPDLQTQERIAHILGTLDDKIELNRRMNQTLEEMAQAIFKSWFVDFDPVRAKAAAASAGKSPAEIERAAMAAISGKTEADLDSLPESQRQSLAQTAALFPAALVDSELGEIPEGWTTGSILAEADLLSGGTPQTSVPEYWDGDLKWASAKDVSQCRETFLIETERQISELGLEKSATRMIPELSTVVVARGATTGRLTMFGSSMGMNQTCYALRSKSTFHFYTFSHAKNFLEILVRSSHGSVFNTITTKTFESSLVIRPGTPLQAAFETVTAPFFYQILSNQRQSRTLSMLRDTLLPKLLSGELSIAAAAVRLEGESGE